MPCLSPSLHLSCRNFSRLAASAGPSASFCRAERPGHPHGTIHRPIETLVTPMGQPYVVHPDRARRDCLFHEAKGFMTEGMMTRAKLFGEFCGCAAGPPNTFATGDLEGASSHGQIRIYGGSLRFARANQYTTLNSLLVEILRLLVCPPAAMTMPIIRSHRAFGYCERFAT
jgi:hypothetical protein